jgi:hypothetical protein
MQWVPSLRSLMTNRKILVRLALLAGMFASAPAQAAIITVGTPVGPGQCNCATIQCAFDFAELGGPHTVRITRSLTYTAQNARLDLDAGESVIVEGGYATCDQAVADATNTIISGSGGSDDTVLEFNLAGTATVHLRRLQVRDGDDTSGYGGGISQVGGTLRIDDSIISNNAADVGGGIYSQDGALEIGVNVLVRLNDADIGGGGIALNNTNMVMNEAGSVILLNHANDGYGGGLWVGPSSFAQIGTQGLPGQGALYANTAAYGGGAALTADEDSGCQLKMVSVNPDQPTGIVANTATVRGGGLYMRSSDSISVVKPLASAELGEGAFIRENVAPDGAAAFLDRDPDEDIAGRLTIYDGFITLNKTVLPDNTPTNGAVLRVADDPFYTGLQLTRTKVQLNDGGNLVHSDGNVLFQTSLVSGNVARLSLFKGVGTDGKTDVNESTIAGNTISAAAVFDVSNDFLLRRSIVYQPGKTSLLQTGGTRTVQNVVASEAASLVDIPGEAVQADPQFWDPAAGDFQLHAASIAVDSAGLTTSAGDVNGNSRTVDLSEVVDRGGPTDLGALERQALTPMVRNHTFVDLRLWQPNTVTFVQDSAVADGSGGVYVSATAPLNGRVIGPLQCIPLPAHGNYGIRGWGKEPQASMLVSDLARLEWQLYLGNTTCTGGASSSGFMYLPSFGTWGQSGYTFFEVPDDEAFRPLASVLIQLVAEDNNASGTNLVDAYFDHIEVEYTGDGNLAPTIVSPILNRTDSEGDPISIETSPHFTDPNGDDLTFSATNLPDGVNIDPGGGAIVGTLSTNSEGEYAVLVRATDPSGASIAQAFAWTVNAQQAEEVFKDGFESD